MKKMLLALLAGSLFAFPNFANAENTDDIADDQPVCVMLKFSDDTRFDKMKPAEELSYLVVEELSKIKKIYLHQAETGWASDDLEARLYNENIGAIEKFESAMESGDYTDFFENIGFNTETAQTIATAEVGQIVSPKITKKISANNRSAKYLIQGTIINLGTGEWLPDDVDFIAGAVSNIAQMASSQGGGMLGNVFSALSYVGNVSVAIRGIGVQCDVRIIEAETGKVIWCKRVKGVGENKLVNSGLFNSGHANINEELYHKAMKKAADKIADALIKDLNSGVLKLK